MDTTGTGNGSNKPREGQLSPEEVRASGHPEDALEQIADEPMDEMGSDTGETSSAHGSSGRDAASMPEPKAMGAVGSHAENPDPDLPDRTGQ